MNKRTMSRWALPALAIALATGLALIPAGAAQARPAAPTQPATAVVTTAEARTLSLVNLYRLYQPGSGDHFYTTSWPEAVNAFNNLGYKYEGVQALVDSVADPGTTPLYRLYHPGISDHFYTTSWPEAINAFNNLGYKYEGIQANVWPTGGGSRVALYRLYHPGVGDHFYTTSWPEAINAFNNLGYKYEGIQAYVY